MFLTSGHSSFTHGAWQKALPQAKASSGWDAQAADLARSIGNVMHIHQRQNQRVEHSKQSELLREHASHSDLPPVSHHGVHEGDVPPPNAGESSEKAAGLNTAHGEASSNQRTTSTLLFSGVVRSRCKRKTCPISPHS